VGWYTIPSSVSTGLFCFLAKRKTWSQPNGWRYARKPGKPTVTDPGLVAKNWLIIHIPLGFAVATAMFVSGATAQSPTMEDRALADVVVTETVMAREADEEVAAAPVARSTSKGSVGSDEERVREYFKDLPVMQEIAFCESTFRQFGADGQPLRGHVNGADVGVMQINEYYHADTAGKLGFNLETIDGNMGYARYLYDTQGVAPWIHSKPCWSKTPAALAYVQ